MRDRDALIAAALVVAGVLIVAWITPYVRPLYEAVSFGPVVIVGLVVVTAVVILRVARSRPSR